MQHDIYLVSRTNKNRKIIVDTKYKIRDAHFKSDPKKGIQQADLYQMVSYAYKRGCTEVFLLYPNIAGELHQPDVFKIRSPYTQGSEILITATEIPFWSVEDFSAIEKKLFTSLERILDDETQE